MATITEDYVSFETATLLKEKGFEGFTMFSYSTNGATMCGHWENETDWLPKCTLQMAMKWLREIHNIVVEPFIREDTKYVWYIHRIEIIFNKKYLVFCWGSKNNKYERYEEACEAAIKYCLEHLI